MSNDENYELGKRHMGSQIAIADCGGFATQYALGSLTTICRHLIAKQGPRYTYDLLQNLADQAASSMVGQEPRP